MSAIQYSIKDVEKVVEGIDGEIKSVNVTRLTAPGENFLSLVFRVDFEVEKNGKTKTVSAVAKRLPLVENIEIFNVLSMGFEIKWYKELLPLIKEVGTEYGIDTDVYPRYLGSRLSLDPTKTKADKESVLLLENLITEGYVNEDRLLGLDVATSKAVLKRLAAFHAIPLIMKFKKPEKFKLFKEIIDSNKFDMPPAPPKKEGEEDKEFEMDVIFDRIVEIPELEPYKANIEVVKRQPKGPMAPNLGPEPWNTISHTDFWVNNIMVKTNEGQEPWIKLVDFQFYQYQPFSRDLVFFLLTSVQDDIQKTQLDDLLRCYYEEFTGIVEKADVPELKLSYEDYLEEVKRAARETEIGHVMFFTTPIFKEKGLVPDFLTGEGNMMDVIESMHKNISERQKEKVIVIIELSVKRGWI